MVGATTDTLAAIDTPLFHDCGLSVVNANCLCRASFDTVRAALAFFRIESYRVVIFGHMEPFTADIRFCLSREPSPLV